MWEPQQQLLKYAKCYGLEYPMCQFCKRPHEMHTCTGPYHGDSVWRKWDNLKESGMTYGEGREKFWQGFHVRAGVVLCFNHLDGALEIWHDSRGASSPLAPLARALPAFPNATWSSEESCKKAEAEKAWLQRGLLAAHDAIRSLEKRLQASEAAKASLEHELHTAWAKNRSLQAEAKTSVERSSAAQTDKEVTKNC